MLRLEGNGGNAPLHLQVLTLGDIPRHHHYRALAFQQPFKTLGAAFKHRGAGLGMNGVLKNLRRIAGKGALDKRIETLGLAPGHHLMQAFAQQFGTRQEQQPGFGGDNVDVMAVFVQHQQQIGNRAGNGAHTRIALRQGALSIQPLLDIP